MDIETYKFICYSLAKAYTTGVRLYENEMLVYYYSVYNIEPDPLGPYLHQIMDSGHEVGIITTSLFQFYAFLTLESGLRVIIGPTHALQDAGKEMDELLAILRIKQEERENYVRLLCSAPVINIERLAWLLVSLATILQGRPFPIEKVWIEKSIESMHEAVQIEYTENKMNNIEDLGNSQAIRQSLSLEQLITSFVESGQTARLREVFSSPPKVYMGSFAHDELRYMKNWGISMVTCMSRAANRGGLDPQKAYIMSELYIQKLELMQDNSSIERLIQEMIIDFSEHVEKLRCSVSGGSPFYRMCIQYISQNIFNAIRLEKMASELDYSRPYLCTRFKQEAGISLTQYIQQEKVEEAKRLLQFSNRDLSEIANLLSFASQSHFQTVFKKITGETPMSYRKRTEITK